VTQESFGALAQEQGVGGDTTPPTPATPPRLATRGIRKEFPGIVALDNVDLVVNAGEVHAIVGQNGAGKSTLVKVLTGIYAADAGEILIDGEVVEIKTAAQARARGIAIVHQDQPAVPKMSVARNAFLGREIRTRYGLLATREMTRRTREALEIIDADFPATALLEDLTAAQRMQSAIAAAFIERPRVLILDEPTASLGAPEAERLFAAIRSVNSAGVTVIYISHRLGEIADLASVATVLRDGRLVERLDLSTSGRGDLIRNMIGRELVALYPKEVVPVAEPVLTVENLEVPGVVEGVDLQVRRGEIVGLAGLVGSGTTQIAESVFGATRSTRTKFELGGKARRVHSPRAAAKAGVALIPPDRRTQGIFASLSVERNLGLAAIPQLSRLGVMNRKAERANAETLIERLSIATTGPDQAAGTLSGGNQQKVVVGKWLARGADLYVLDEPTAGVDVGSKVELYLQMTEVAKAGAGLLLVSSDFEELLAMCDRVLVIVNGRVSREVVRGEVGLEELIALAAGGLVQGHAARAANPTGPSEPAPVPPATPPAQVRRTAPPSTMRRFQARFMTPTITAVAMVALCVCLGVGKPAFFGLDNLMTVARQGSVAALIACGLTLALAVGGFDLSVGGVSQVAANVVTLTVIAGAGTGAALGVGAGVGLVIGLVNALVIYLLRVPSFVATLGTLFLTMAASLQLNGGLKLSISQSRVDFLVLGQGYLSSLGIPVVAVVLVLAVVVLHVWLRHLPSGGRIYATGGNPDAAVLRGVNTRKYTVVAFVVAGVIAGFAGVLSASYSSGVSAVDHSMALLVAAASASFLGSALSPTREFNVIGSAVAALFVAAISNGLIMNGVSNLIVSGIQGLVLLAAVVVASVRKRELGQVAIF
jgi:ribose transport system ATP-binding protein